MKKTTLLLLTALFANTANAQENKPSFNRWSVDVNAGINKAGRNYTPGYSSALIGIGELNFGARYMLNPYFGMDMKLGFDRFQDSKASPDFASNMGRFQIQGIVNMSNALNFYQWTDKFGLLAHFGVGVGNFVKSGFPLLAKLDKIGTVTFGLTPQLKLGSKWSVNFDASIVGVGRLHHTWDYKSNSNSVVSDNPIDGGFYTASFGVSYYLGKREQHADWSPNKFVSKSDLDDLKKDIDAMRAGMNDDDKDGVPNYLDQEPNSSEGLKVNLRGAVDLTLNDTDNDGIADAYDECPDVKGTFLANGCPDADGDGTADKNDKCPNMAGPLWDNGCPSANGDNILTINPPLENPNFLVGSAELSKNDLFKLDRVAEIMKANPNYKLIVKGHTDNVGEFDFNQTLSERRAVSGRDYLLNKGVNPMQIQTVGYDYSQPLNKDNTAADRAKNRRIEFEIRN